MAMTPERRPLVLLVGSSPAVEARLRRLLQDGGFEVDDAVTGAPRRPDAGVADVKGLTDLMAMAAAAEAALADRNAQLAHWAGRTGHDLMTPLAVISGMAETLQSAWDRLGDDDRARLLESIRNQAARATAILDEGLALARASPPSG